MVKLGQKTNEGILVASALALLACSSSSTWKGNGIDSSAVDGIRPAVDSTTTDTTLAGVDRKASGGASGSGGGIAYDASRQGGSGRGTATSGSHETI
jgi:hypothetical protein